MQEKEGKKGGISHSYGCRSARLQRGSYRQLWFLLGHPHKPHLFQALLLSWRSSFEHFSSSPNILAPLASLPPSPIPMIQLRGTFLVTLGDSKCDDHQMMGCSFNGIEFLSCRHLFIRLSYVPWRTSFELCSSPQFLQWPRHR